MEFAYVAVAIVAGLILGFAFLCVVWITGRVSRGIRDRSVELMSSYDLVFEEKKEELDALLRQKQQAAEIYNGGSEALSGHQASGDDDVSALVSVAEKVATAGYRNKGFGEDYKSIRMSFTHDPGNIADVIDETVSKSTGKATKILGQLDYSTVYSLSVLSPDEQLSIFGSVLDEDGTKLLEEFLSVNKRFSIIDFYDFLKSKASVEPQQTTLVISAADSARSYPEWINIRKDDDIIEGFEIETGGELYDYGIRKREVV